MFHHDLVRAIGGALEVEFLGVSSYQGSTKTTSVVRDPERTSRPLSKTKTSSSLRTSSIPGLHALPSSTCSPFGSLGASPAHLLDKPPTEVEMSADYVGFSIPDRVRRGTGLTSPNATETSPTSRCTPHDPHRYRQRTCRHRRMQPSHHTRWRRLLLWPDRTHTRGRLGEDRVRTQAEAALRNLDAILNAAGGSRDRVIRATIFLASMDDFSVVNRSPMPPFSASMTRPSVRGGQPCYQDALVKIRLRRSHTRRLSSVVFLERRRRRRPAAW